MYINKAMVFGNLTRDPELKSLPSGMQVASFSLATNSTYKDGDGNQQEQVEYHNITVFGRQAETSAQYLKKGSSAYVEGRLQTRSWDKDSVKMYRTEIVAERVQFGPQGGGAGGSKPATNSTPVAPAKAANTAPEYPDDDINPEDIPFS